MPIRSSINRAVFYSANDLAAGAAKERVCSLLRDIPCSTSDINDAIELIQCACIVEECSYLFATKELTAYQTAANKARHFALKEIGAYFSENDIASLYEILEIEYIE